MFSRACFLLGMAFAVSGCENSTAPASKGSPQLGAEEAKYEAQKVLAALKGKAQSAAFMDQALAIEPLYQEVFVRGLRTVVASAPKESPAFLPYVPCVKAGEALLKFAELRKIAGRQNAESDQYREPYWKGLAACEAAINGAKQ